LNDKVRLVELERKLVAERRRRQDLENRLESARRWAQAWKRAAKSELEVLRVIRNRRKLRLIAGADEVGYHSGDHFELLENRLAEALREIQFLEKERERWMENAQYFRSVNEKMRLRVANLEMIAEKMDARAASGNTQNISDIG
jgi:phage shock protein A